DAGISHRPRSLPLPEWPRYRSDHQRNPGERSGSVWGERKPSQGTNDARSERPPGADDRGPPGSRPATSDLRHQSELGTRDGVPARAEYPIHLPLQLLRDDDTLLNPSSL